MLCFGGKFIRTCKFFASTKKWTLNVDIMSIHYATSRQVAGSIPNEVIEFFNWPNPASRTIALGVDSASKRNEYEEFSCG
jgi:hypothetical protein